MPSTLPTPIQVSRPWTGCSQAAVMVTPRVRTNDSWHWRKRTSRGSPARRFNTPSAIAAAAAASVPWPSPSITASKRPSGRGLNRCTSPHTCSPGSAREATPQSTNFPDMIALSAISIQPLRHLDGRAYPNFGLQKEFVHEPFRPRQPHTQTAARRVAVLHGAGDVRDARPMVASHHIDPRPGAVIQRPQQDLAALGVVEDVAGDF